MTTQICSDTIVTGRFVVYTRSSQIARMVEESVERNGSADHAVSGVAHIDGMYVEWFALPSEALVGDNHFP